LEVLAIGGDASRYSLPRALLGRAGCDFSFSGLKTAAARLAETVRGDIDRRDLAAAVQGAIARQLADRSERAMGVYAEAHSPGRTDAAATKFPSPPRGGVRGGGVAQAGGIGRDTIAAIGADTPIPNPFPARGNGLRFVVAGGVAANSEVRRVLEGVAAAQGFSFTAPPLEYCTDNAAMIALAGAERLALGLVDGLDAVARPRWPLDEEAARNRPTHVAGRKGAKA